MNNKFKTTFRLVETIICVAIIGLLCALALPALADQSTQSFNATNEIDASTLIITDPTNANGFATGNAISVDNYDRLGFYLKGSNATANASAFTVKLVKSAAASPSVNSTNRDYETSPTISISFTTPAAAGRYYFYTNLDSYAIGSARYIGVASVTNATASASFTGAELGISRKIIPTRFP